MAFPCFLLLLAVVCHTAHSYTVQNLPLDKKAVDFVVELKVKPSDFSISRDCRRTYGHNQLSCSINIPGLSQSEVKSAVLKATRLNLGDIEKHLVQIYHVADPDPTNVYMRQGEYNQQKRKFPKRQLKGPKWRMIKPDRSTARFCTGKIPWYRSINRANRHLDHKYTATHKRPPKKSGNWETNGFEGYCAPKAGACRANLRLYEKAVTGRRDRTNHYHVYTADNPNPTMARKNIGKPTNCFVWSK